MRLKVVEKGHGLRTRLMFGMFRIMMRARAPDVIRTILYRPDLFGRPYSIAMQEIMRGPSAWTPGERELFAAFVSKKNQCPF